MKISVSDDKHLCIENNDWSNPHFVKGESKGREFHVKEKDLLNHGFTDKYLRQIKSLTSDTNIFIDE